MGKRLKTPRIKFIRIIGRKIKIPVFKAAVFSSIIPAILKKMEAPAWLALNKEKFECNVVGDPSLAEVNPPVQIPLVFEFYSR